MPSMMDVDESSSSNDNPKPSEPEPRCIFRKMKRSASAHDLVALANPQDEHSAELLSRIGASSLDKISQGLATASSRPSQTIAAPGRALPRHSFEAAASLFEAPKKHANHDNMCSICLELCDPGECRELPCGHRFHLQCIVRYSKSKPSTKTMPCPDCRHPFSAFHDQDSQGHAQAREMLCDSATVSHYGIRNIRLHDDVVQSTRHAVQATKSETDPVVPAKREREPPHESPANSTPANKAARVTSLPEISDLLHSISTDLAELKEQTNPDQQAVNILQTASLGELLATLPQPVLPQPVSVQNNSHVPARQQRLRRKKITSYARMKRRQERQRLLMFENALTDLESQQKQLEQQLLALNHHNQWLTAQVSLHSGHECP